MTALGALLSAQTHLKFWPQIGLISFAILTTVSVKNDWKTGTINLSIVVGMGFAVILFIIVELFLNIILPHRGYVIDESGQAHGVMDFSWIWALLLMAITVPFVLKKYLSSPARTRGTEAFILGTYCLCGFLLFLIAEVI